MAPKQSPRTEKRLQKLTSASPSAASKIAHFFLRSKKRARVTLLEDSATKLQARWRGFIVRRDSDNTKIAEEEAERQKRLAEAELLRQKEIQVNVIQFYWKNYKQRKLYQRMKDGCLTIQSCGRGYMARKSTRKERSAAKIQKKYRSIFYAKVEAIVVIQRVLRRMFSKRLQATKLIQRCYRGHIGRQIAKNRRRIVEKRKAMYADNTWTALGASKAPNPFRYIQGVTDAKPREVFEKKDGGGTLLRASEGHWKHVDKRSPAEHPLFGGGKTRESVPSILARMEEETGGEELEKCATLEELYEHPLVSLKEKEMISEILALDKSEAPTGVDKPRRGSRRKSRPSILVHNSQGSKGVGLLDDVDEDADSKTFAQKQASLFENEKRKLLDLQLKNASLGYHPLALFKGRDQPLNKHEERARAVYESLSIEVMREMLGVVQVKTSPDSPPKSKKPKRKTKKVPKSETAETKTVKQTQEESGIEEEHYTTQDEKRLEEQEGGMIKDDQATGIPPGILVEHPSSSTLNDTFQSESILLPSSPLVNEVEIGYEPMQIEEKEIEETIDPPSEGDGGDAPQNQVAKKHSEGDKPAKVKKKQTKSREKKLKAKKGEKEVAKKEEKQVKSRVGPPMVKEKKQSNPKSGTKSKVNSSATPKG